MGFMNGLMLFVSLYFLLVYVAGFFYRLKEVGSFKSDSLIYALVPSHREGETLLKCLRSLSAVFGSNVAVVLDDSDDDEALASSYASLVYKVNFKNKDKALRMALSSILKDVPKVEGVFIFDADNVIDSDFKKVYKFLPSGSLSAVSVSMDVGRSVWGRFGGIIASVFLHMQRGFMVLFGRSFVNGYGLFIPRVVMSDYVGFNAVTITEDIERSGAFSCRFIDIKGLYNSMPADFGGFFRQRLRWFIGSFEAFFVRFFDYVKSFYLLPFFLGLFLLPVSLIGLVSPVNFAMWCYIYLFLYYAVSRFDYGFLDGVIFPFMVVVISLIGVISLLFPARWYRARSGVRREMA